MRRLEQFQVVETSSRCVPQSIVVSISTRRVHTPSWECGQHVYDVHIISGVCVLLSLGVPRMAMTGGVGTNTVLRLSRESIYIYIYIARWEPFRRMDLFLDAGTFHFHFYGLCSTTAPRHQQAMMKSTHTSINQRLPIPKKEKE